MPTGLTVALDSYCSADALAHLYYKIYKVEVSVLPNGFAIDCTNHYPGSYSDIDIMHRNKASHDTALRKCEGEKQIVDGGLHAEDLPDHWSVIADKEYQEELEFIRAIPPHKRPARGLLSFSEEAFNRKLSSDRIIVEMFLGTCAPSL